MKQEQKEEKIVIPTINMESYIITIEGESPLITGRFSSDLSNNPKDNSPAQQIKNSIHYLSDGSYGYPARAIQKAIINACRIKQKDVKTYKMTELRGVFSVIAEDETGLLKLDCKDHTTFERIVYNKNNAIKSHYAKYDKWKLTFELIFNPSVKSLKDFLYLLTLAGQFVGLGVLRPQAQDSGEYGRFKIIKVEHK
jgi:hypothetical protein